MTSGATTASRSFSNVTRELKIILCTTADRGAGLGVAFMPELSQKRINSAKSGVILTYTETCSITLNPTVYSVGNATAAENLIGSSVETRALADGAAG